MNTLVEIAIRHRILSAALVGLLGCALVFMLRPTPGAPASTTPARPARTVQAVLPTAGPAITATASPDSRVLTPTTRPATEAVPTQVEASIAASGGVMAAATFTRTWLSGRTLPPDAWYDALSGVAAPALVDGLRTTDPANIPDAEMESAPALIATTQFGASFEVDLTDQTTIQVVLTYGSEGWRAVDVLPLGDL